MVMDMIKTFRIPVFVADLICVSKERVQYKFPKQKSHRRRKKWANNPKNYRWEEQHRAIEIDGQMFVSSEMYKTLWH